MELYLVGRMLKELRTRRKLTQEDLADVCSLTTISRIENEGQIPSRRVVEALFQKLGYGSPANDVPAKKAELKRHNLEKQMSKLSSHGNYEFKDLLDEYKNFTEEMDAFEKQAYLFYSAVYDTEHSSPHEKVLAVLTEALNLTFPDYFAVQKNKEREILLSQNELLIISNIAIEKQSLGLTDEAIAIMEDLKTYYEKNIFDEEEREKHFAVVLMKLADWYDDKGEYQKAMKMCEQGILNCSKSALPSFIINKGYFYYKLDEKEKGIETIKDGLKLMKYLNQRERMKEVRKNMQQILGINIE